MKQFEYKNLIEQIKKDFKIDYYGDHGIYHWERVYENSQILSSYYKIESEVFELFALLHDSKREDEYSDIYHGKRASIFVQELLDDGTEDAKRLIYACVNHTSSSSRDRENPLVNDIVVQICFDSDRLDIGRVGYVLDKKYFATNFAKSLIVDGDYKIKK